MIETISLKPEIYKINIPLKGNALRNLNCYVLKSNGKSLVIDTGFNTEDCKEHLIQGLKELDLELSDTALFFTHLHSDHTGLAEVFAEKNCQMYMGEKEFTYWKYTKDIRYWEYMDKLYIDEGFPIDVLEAQKNVNPARVSGARKAFPVTTVKDGSTIQIGDITLECLEVPGHTPGHICLYLRESRIMFLGDHVLYDITPNVSEWAGMKNSLGHYLSSLRKVKNYEIELALPAHRGGNEKPVFQRIDEIILHHEKRLEETRQILREHKMLTAYEVASYMKWSLHGATWETAPRQQHWFAMGEARTHLAYLEEEGSIGIKNIDGKKVYFMK